ncbi:MAG: nuclease-related domain-containing protein [Candidatus Heimdallarchaeota archaeon]
MAKIVNQSGALEGILKILYSNGISQFNSLETILDFQTNWGKDIEDYKVKQRNKLSLEKEKREELLKRMKISYVRQTTKRRDELLEEKQELSEKLDYYERNEPKNFLQKLFRWFKARRIVKRKTKLDNNFEFYVEYPFRILKKGIDKSRAEINYISNNFEQIVNNMAEAFIKRQLHIKSILDELKFDIIGAIGEDKAIKELTKLPDNYHVINNFQLRFSRPIYHQNENDYIYSIQVDHLVVGPSGVYLIETKYWSKESVENSNLFSPVKQIKRASYAIFLLLNDAAKNSYIFSNHHWGNKKISVRNIILMIGHKPKEEFQFVKILSLDRIVGYITYFKPIFSDQEVYEIVKILKDLNRKF